ncbi:MAG: hypothetical protein ACI8WB_006262 [Phenylobacterium sp.]|jgi:hypothetical protein
MFSGLFQPSLAVSVGDYAIAGEANKGLYRQQSIHSLFFTEHYQAGQVPEQTSESSSITSMLSHIVQYADEALGRYLD